MWSKKELIEKRARFWLVIASGSTLQAACNAVEVAGGVGAKRPADRFRARSLNPRDVT